MEGPLYFDLKAGYRPVMQHLYLMAYLSSFIRLSPCSSNDSLTSTCLLAQFLPSDSS